MSRSDSGDEVVGYLIAAAKAHHAATGGDNPRWANWYANYLRDDFSRVLDTDLDVSELEAFLVEADRRYREEPQTMSWPRAYATWLREAQGGEA